MLFLYNSQDLSWKLPCWREWAIGRRGHGELERSGSQGLSVRGAPPSWVSAVLVLESPALSTRPAPQSGPLSR